MIGRKKEFKMLRNLLESDESEFSVLYGRRRIGKTYLVNEALGKEFAFHHSGLREGNTRKQLDAFRLALRTIGAYWKKARVQHRTSTPCSSANRRGFAENTTNCTVRFSGIRTCTGKLSKSLAENATG